ncbi:MAG TPA: ACT domain-containing protein [Polyangiales bacterium]|jgi:glycine cleavage system regulatory protein|nr:ACT domain-containing protein [Polyangiales bacterium]
MRASMVLTIIGPDRSGIVELLADTVAAHGGNWEQSRMAQLAGQFAGILNISLPEERSAELHAALQQLSSRGLRVVAEVTAVPERRSFRSLRLELTGDDREGIVRDVSRALAARGVNVEELDTSCESAPMAGGSLFHAHAVLRAPVELDLGELRKTLESLADDLMVDVALFEPSDRK